MNPKAILEFLQGKKTYVVAGLAAIATFLTMAGIMTWEQLKFADMILAPLGLAFLRAGVDNAVKSGK